MPYKLVKGHFCLYYRSTRHVGARPDGDSLWFKPDNPEHLHDIDGRSVDYNKGGFAQLRFEGIDALELHYRGSNHQIAPQCSDARDRLLNLAGFSNVTYAPSKKIDTSIRTATPYTMTGYILTRNADPYGRPVSFVFPDDTNEGDGSDVWLSPGWVESSFNAKLAKEGQAYPAFYTGLPTDVRNYLGSLTKRARQRHRGIWEVDASRSENLVAAPGDLGQIAIWPKLYRRLFAYFKDGNTTIAGFDNWIRENRGKDDSLWILSRAEFGNLHDIYEIDGDKIKMQVTAEDMVILPR